MDLANFAERNFATWGWARLFGASALALAIFLLVSNLVTRPFAHAAERQAASDGEVRHGVLRRWRDLENPREFTELNAPGGARPYGIAWIYGSEAAIRSAPPAWRLHGRSDYELTEVLAEYAPEVNGRPVVVHEFRESGLRSGDQRRAVLYAASAPEIDAIILPLAPMWLFNDYVLFNPTNRRADLLRYRGLSAVDAAVALALLHPADIAGEILQAYLPFHRYRFDINQSAYRSTALPFLATKPRLNLTGSLAQIWLNLLFPHELVADTPASLRGSEFLRAAMLMGPLSRESMGARLFKANLRTLAASGKPAVLYLQPLDPGIRDDPQVLRRLQDFIALVGQIAAEVDAPNVLIATQTVYGTKPPFEHIELYHLKDGQGVVETLVDLLEKASGSTFGRADATRIYADAESAKTGGDR
jgi:hypothetical protein